MCLEELVEKEKTSKNVLVKGIQFYQNYISKPLNKTMAGKKGMCRYTPSCSQYGKEAILKYGTFKGSYMAAKRILRCNPWSKGGHDPVK